MDNSDAKQSSEPSKSVPIGRCRCGESPVDSPHFIPEPRYSMGAVLVLGFGVTARPKRVDFVCGRCRQVAYRAYDQATIREHTN